MTPQPRRYHKDALHAACSPALGPVRLLAYALLTLALLPVQWLAVIFRRPLSYRLPVWYHRLCCRILGIEVVVHGRVSRHRPTLFVSNHSSYLDIPVLGSRIEGSFVAKTEVGSWPLFGTLARLQHTVFVDRRARNAKRDSQSLRSRLDRGDCMILFPEGTSSDGNRTLAFKSALFGVAGVHAGTASSALTVQPVSIVPTHLDGIPLGREYRAVYAWYGDTDLAPHLWSMIGMGRLRVQIAFHEPVPAARFTNRKALADHCWCEVADGVAGLLSGRRGQKGRCTATDDRAAA